MALVGTEASNYSLTQPAGLTADITARPVTIDGATANDRDLQRHRRGDGELRRRDAAEPGVRVEDASDVDFDGAHDPEYFGDLQWAWRQERRHGQGGDGDRRRADWHGGRELLAHTAERPGCHHLGVGHDGQFRGGRQDLRRHERRDDDDRTVTTRSAATTSPGWRGDVRQQERRHRQDRVDRGAEPSAAPTRLNYNLTTVIDGHGRHHGEGDDGQLHGGEQGLRRQRRRDRYPLATGAVGGDDVEPDGGTATFDNKNVGTGKTVTLTGASLAGRMPATTRSRHVATTRPNITAKR